MSKTVLIIDDQENDRVILERLLRQQGVVNPVVSISEGEDAICYLKGEGRYVDRAIFPFPAVIFLDILFPTRSGLEVLHCLKTLKPSPKPLTIIYTKLTDIKTGNGPDAIIYDEASGKILVMNHKDGTVTLISPNPGSQFTSQELKIGGMLEAAVVDCG